MNYLPPEEKPNECLTCSEPINEGKEFCSERCALEWITE